jgi:hypothetical protein
VVLLRVVKEKSAQKFAALFIIHIFQQQMILVTEFVSMLQSQYSFNALTKAEKLE